MAADYTEYTKQYNYMNNILRQVQSQQNGNGLYNNLSLGNVQTGVSFWNIFNNVMSAMTPSALSNAASNAAQYAVSDIKVPESMDAIFEEAARKYDVPVNLLKAMGKAESGFDANAVSSAGAKGVMQLMPSTARSLGVEDPFDARSNIMGGAKYISQKLKKYDGNIDLALAAYNAGSGNVRKYGGVPPFKETRNYISRIKKYMGMDIDTDRTVYTRKADKTEYANQQGIFGQQDALYFVELMKLQMQNRMMVSGWNMENNETNYL